MARTNLFNSSDLVQQLFAIMPDKGMGAQFISDRAATTY